MNYKQIKAIEQTNKNRLLAVNNQLNERSGIYFLLRTDENRIKYAYIGQAKHILTRLAQHLVGYQHIDLSLKKHGLYNFENPHGWRIGFVECEIEELDDMEKHYIKLYADNGYQLRNKTSGGQGVGKSQIDDFKPHKTYRDGILQGKKVLARDLKHIIDKHLDITLKDGKKGNKVSQKAFDKFMELLNEENYERTKQNE